MPRNLLLKNKKIIPRGEEAGKKIQTDLRTISNKFVFFQRNSRRIISKQSLSVTEKNALYEERIECANECASVLYRNGAKRVWLFGSLAESNRDGITDKTDIDIAVEGMNKARFEQVRRRIQKKSDFKVDVIFMETSNPGFRKEIMKKRIFLAK